MDTHMQLIHQNMPSKEWLVCVTFQEPQSNRPREMPLKLKRVPKRVPKHITSQTWGRGGATEHKCVFTGVMCGDCNRLFVLN